MRNKVLIFLTAVMCVLPLAAQMKIQWGSPDVRYSTDTVDTGSVAPVDKAVAWRGERVNFQLVVEVNVKGENTQLEYEFTDLKCGKSIIPASNVVGGFVQHVITDKFTGCGKHAVDAHGENFVADRIVADNPQLFAAGKHLRGLWFTVQVPHDVKPGKYQGSVKVKSAGATR